MPTLFGARPNALGRHGSEAACRPTVCWPPRRSRSFSAIFDGGGKPRAVRPSWTGSTLSIKLAPRHNPPCCKSLSVAARLSALRAGTAASTQDKRGTPRGHSGVSSHMPHGTKTTHGPELTLEERREPRRLRREKQRENNVDRAAKMHAARLKMEATSLKTTAKHPSSFRATLPVTTGRPAPHALSRGPGVRSKVHDR
jgi:hypothetical protein